MWCWWWLWLLPLTAEVPVGPLESPCGSDQYELHGLCCDFCPAGFYVSRLCDVDRATECSPCEPGSYMAHRNRETACLPCAECRDGDQELVSNCTRDSNRRCQCKTGSYYCDSEDCVEACHRCSRCDGPTLKTCNATRDTICATKRNPEPGDPPRPRADSSHVWAVVVTVILAIVAIVAIAVAVMWCRRQGVQLSHLLVHCLKRERRDSGGPGSPQPGVNLLPEDAERSLPAADAESALLLEQPGTVVAPSEDPEARVQPQEVMPEGSGASLEQAPQAQPPAAPGGPDQTEAAAPLHALEQQYEQKYALKDGSPEAMNRIYFEFGQQVPQRSWRMFMRFAGLDENDIVICEHENPGNLAEQHHRMLLCWQNKLGRAASPCRLMAALCKMGLRESLENVINKLVAEDILSSKDAEPPN